MNLFFDDSFTLFSLHSGSFFMSFSEEQGRIIYDILHSEMERGPVSTFFPSLPFFSLPLVVLINVGKLIFKKFIIWDPFLCFTLFFLPRHRCWSPARVHKVMKLWINKRSKQMAMWLEIPVEILDCRIMRTILTVFFLFCYFRVWYEQPSS